jgi:hypothetical protein
MASLHSEKSEREWLVDRPEDELRNLMAAWAADLAAGRVYGFGLSLNYLRGGRWLDAPEWPIRFFFDNNPALHHQRRHGLEILPPAEIPNHPGRLLVFPVFYASVKRQLESMGLTEYVDFMRAADFIPLWHWYRYGKVVLQAIVAVPTLKCVLNCAECNMLIPLNRHPRHYELDRLKADLDRLMALVDDLHFLGIIGGEALLHPRLADYIEYAAERHGDKIGEITILTNGLVTPGPELRRAFRDCRVFIKVNDYGLGEGIPEYASRLRRFIEVLEDDGIPHAVDRMRRWNRRYFDEDCGSEPELREHYRNCLGNVSCSSFDGGKFYPCGPSWAAGEAGWIANAPGDYLDMTALNPDRAGDRLKLVRAYLGWSEKGFLELCRRCHGTDPDRCEPVPAALQAPR